MVEVIYSAQRRGFEKGRIYENPQFFEKVNPLCTRAIVIGDWPKVVAAYQEAGVEVVTTFAGKPAPAPAAPAPAVQTDPGEDLSKATFDRIKELVAKIDPDKKVISKKEGIAFLEAHKAPAEPKEPETEESKADENLL